MTDRRFDPDIEGFLGDELTHLKETDPPDPPEETTADPYEAYEPRVAVPEPKDEELEARLRWALGNDQDVEAAEPRPSADDVEQPDLFAPPPAPTPPPVVQPPAPIGSPPEPVASPPELIEGNPPGQAAPAEPAQTPPLPSPTEVPPPVVAPDWLAPHSAPIASPEVIPPEPVAPPPAPIASSPVLPPAVAPAPPAQVPPVASSAPVAVPAPSARIASDTVSILEIATPDEGGVREVALPGNRALSPASPAKARRMGWDHPVSRAVVYLLIVVVLTLVFLLILINLFHLS